jgi:hypothetical protein
VGSMTRRTPTDAELVELHDRLWNDPRRRDDRSEFHECASCGRAVRWIANLASGHGSSMQVVARPVTTAALFDPAAHAGLVAVFTDRTGFTVGAGTSPHDIEDAFLYQCHWDVCDDARRTRDRIAGDRRRALDADIHAQSDADQDVVRRYALWRGERHDA